MLAKFSILLFYLRLSPYRYFRVAIYGLSVIIAASSLVNAFQFLFDCTPMAKAWDITIIGGSCIEYGKLWVLNSAVNTATDILMILLPASMMRHVRIPKRQKVAVTAIFMVGVLYCCTNFK